MPSDYASHLTSINSAGAGALRRRSGLDPKRAFDVVFALVLLPLVLPVIFVLWALIRLQGGAGAPGFFRHTRVGRNGRPFDCMKLRTMVPDADLSLAALLAHDPRAREEWARDVKLQDDPRVTRFGRILRKTSLDELPQIFNVLAGDMSFVGPRPIPAEELERYGRAKYAYLSVRPGITGSWQVSGRNDVDYDTRIALDVGYARDRSLAGDLRILLRTVGVVLRKTGC